MAATELLAPVPSASDYSVSADLWQRLEDEVIAVSNRIAAGDDLVPDDVANVQKLKKQVDNYVTGFNKAIRDASSDYRKLVDRRLAEIGFNNIEEFVHKKRQEQTAEQNKRIAYKMEMLKNISEQLIIRTKTLKDTPVAKELLPAFVARFPKVQSGAKTNAIDDWRPYFNIMAHAVSLLVAFFADPQYEDAVMLPLYSTTIRELLAYARDGNPNHLENLKEHYKEDQEYIRIEKMKQRLLTTEDGIKEIQGILEDIDNMDNANEAVHDLRIGQAWEEITRVVSLINNNQ